MRNLHCAAFLGYVCSSAGSFCCLVASWAVWHSAAKYRLTLLAVATAVGVGDVFLPMRSLRCLHVQAAVASVEPLLHFPGHGCILHVGAPAGSQFMHVLLTAWAGNAMLPDLAALLDGQ